MRTISLIMAISLALFCAGTGLAQETVWKTVDPGGNGGVTFTSINPTTGHLYTSSDMSRSLFRSTDQAATWTPIANPVTGTPDYVAADPSAPETLYLRQQGETEKSSGMWKSTDNGDTWTQISTDPRFGSRSNSHSGLVDPDNGKILYWTSAGRGERGILRSTDGGYTWEDWSKGLPKDQISYPVDFAHTLEFDPDSTLENRRIFYPTNLGVFEASEPSGEWRLVPGLPKAPCGDVEACKGGIIFAAMGKEGLYKSADGGKTWKRITDGLENKAVERVVATNDRPDMVYASITGAAVSSHPDFGTNGVYGSKDHGETWQCLTYAKFNGDYNFPINYRQAEGVYVRELFVAPNDPWTVYVIRGMISKDGGKTWGYFGMKELRRDRWQGQGLPLLTQYRVTFDPLRKHIIWFGFSDTGLMLSDDGGETIMNVPTFHRGAVNQGAYWRDKLVRSSGSSYAVAVDPDRPTTIYASISGKSNESRNASGGIIIKSVDGGWNWDAIYETHGLDDGIIRTILIDPNSPIRNRTIYVASHMNGIYKSTDDGKTFENIGPGKLMGKNTRVMYLAMAPSDSQTLYCGVGGSNGNRPLYFGKEKGLPFLEKEMYGGVFKTTDGGKKWEKCNTTREIPSVQEVIVHPENPDIAYVAAYTEDFLVPENSPHQEWKEGGIFKTMDGGKTWENVFPAPNDGINGQGEIQSISMNQLCPEIVYAVVANYGCYRTLDDGKTWEPLGKASMDRRQRRYFSIQLNPHDPAEVWIGHFGNAFSKGVDYQARQRMEEKFLRGNLVANPGFEELDKNDMPLKWRLEQPDAPKGEKPVFSVSKATVKDGTYAARFNLTQAYPDAPSPIPGMREQTKLEKAGIMKKDRADRIQNGATKTWLSQTIDPYFTSMMRGKRIMLEMDLFVADGDPGHDAPQVYVAEARDYGVHWPVVETYLEDLEPVLRMPASEMKGKWYRVKSVGNVTEDALWLKIVLVGVPQTRKAVESYADNVRLSVMQE